MEIFRYVWPDKLKGFGRIDSTNMPHNTYTHTHTHTHTHITYTQHQVAWPIPYNAMAAQGMLIHVWCDFFICVACLIHNACHFSFTCVPLLVHVCDMTRSHVCRDSFLWVLCAMAHSYVWHDSFTCVPQHIHMCAMTYSYVWPMPYNTMTAQGIRIIFICAMTHSFATWLIHMWHDSFICDMTHSYVTCLTCHQYCHNDTNKPCVPWLIPWPMPYNTITA